MSSAPPKPKLRLDFLNAGFIKDNNLFYNILRPHYDIELTDHADFVIYNHVAQKQKLTNAVRIFWTQEAYQADLSQCDYAITGFYPRSEREFRLAPYADFFEPQDLVRPPGLDYNKIAASKKHFCGFMTTYAGRKTKHRSDFFHILNRYKKVDSAGKALNNVGYQVPWGFDKKREWMRDYKFFIAFESCMAEGWLTEKLTDPLLAHTVPIFWGSNAAVKDFNPQSFINAGDFSSFEELAEYVRLVDNDPELYLKYLSAAPYHGNVPNENMDRGRLLAFLRRIFTTPIEPVSARQWRFFGSRWVLAKRDPFRPVQFLDAKDAP